MKISLGRLLAISLVCMIGFGLESVYGEGLKWPPPKFPESSYGPPPTVDNSAVIEYIKQNLKDPDSAHIRLMEGKPERGPIIVDGQWKPGYTMTVFVNAKNSYGGYTGEHRFWVNFYMGRIIDCIDVSKRR